MEERFPFKVIAHTVSVFPFRQYAHASLDEQSELCLAVKQYVPQETARTDRSTIANTEPITIVAAGGLGFVKELYEPLFAELLVRAQVANLTIKAIWIADMFNTGQSAVLNRSNLGCDPAWVDHARDLFCIIHHFRSEMTRPMFGLGHSMGCNQLVYLSHWHPRLFNSFAFIEAGVDPEYGKGILFQWARQTLKRRESWPTRQEAEMELIKFHVAAGWDSRVVSRLRQYGVHQVANEPKAEWAPTTPKHQIAALVFRANPDKIGSKPGGLDEVTLEERESVPDIDPAAPNSGPFYRVELKGAWDLLPSLRPWVLYINAGKSPFFGRQKTSEQRARITGTGVGGNGGIKLGAIEQVVVDSGEHTMVFDKHVETVADHVARWFEKEANRWHNGEMKSLNEWQIQSLSEKQSVSNAFKTELESQVQLSRRQKL